MDSMHVFELLIILLFFEPSLHFVHLFTEGTSLLWEQSLVFGTELDFSRPLQQSVHVRGFCFTLLQQNLITNTGRVETVEIISCWCLRIHYSFYNLMNFTYFGLVQFNSQTLWTAEVQVSLHRGFGFIGKLKHGLLLAVELLPSCQCHLKMTDNPTKLHQFNKD